MKRIQMLIIAYILISVILLGVPSTALAEGENRVFDKAELLSEAQRSALQSRIEEFRSTYRADMAVLTYDDNEGKTTRNYAMDFYEARNLGSGEGAEYDGVLLLINMDDREMFVLTSGKMIDVLDDARIDEILDVMFEHAQDADYYNCFYKGIEKIDAFTLAGPKEDQYRGDEDEYGPVDELEIRERKLEKLPFAILASVGAAAAISGIAILLIKRNYEHKKYSPYSYGVKSHVNYTVKNDILIDTNVTRRYSPPPPTGGRSGGGSSGGGSRSTTFSSGSGRSYGGGGRKF